jgi:hypothetical protein
MVHYTMNVTDISVESVAFLIHFLEVPVTNLGRETCYPD